MQKANKLFELQFRLIFRSIGTSIFVVIFFGVSLALFIILLDFSEDKLNSISVDYQESFPMPAVPLKRIKYSAQYDKNDPNTDMLQFFTDNNDYHILSDNKKSSDYLDMQYHLTNSESDIGLLFDNYKDKKFSGRLMLKKRGGSFLSALVAIADSSTNIINKAMPKALVELQDQYSMMSFGAVMAIAFIISNPQALYFPFAKNRVEGRKDVMIFAGLSKIHYHVSWNFIVALIFFCQLLVILIISSCIGYNLTKGMNYAIFLPCFFLLSCQVATLCDCLQNISKSVESYQQIFPLLSMFLFFFPVLLIGIFMSDIPTWAYLVFSMLPAFPLINMVQSCYYTSYYNKEAALADVYLRKNLLIVQLCTQLIYVVIQQVIAIVLDKAMVKSNSKVDGNPITESEILTPQQQKSSIFNMNVNKTKAYVAQLYGKIKNVQSKTVKQEEKHQLYTAIENSTSNMLKPLNIGSNSDSKSPRVERVHESGLVAQNEKDVSLLIYNISKLYKDGNVQIQANSNINLVIKKNEIYGILGPNGSGKTTLCKAIMMAQTIDSGDILVDGLSVRKDFKQVASKIGLCLQNDAGLFEELTVDEHLDFYAAIANKKTQLNVLQKFNLEEHRHKKSKELSGGWKRRLTVACALLNDPDVLVLDEITSGVDAVAREELWALLKQICAQKTIIATTHTLHEAQTYFDRCAFIFKGRIHCIGSVQEILDKVKNQICFEVRGFLEPEFFQKIREMGFEVDETQQNRETRVQFLEAVSKRDNIEELFAELIMLQQQNKIENFAISQRQFDQVFYELMRLAE